MSLADWCVWLIDNLVYYYIIGNLVGWTASVRIHLKLKTADGSVFLPGDMVDISVCVLGLDSEKIKMMYLLHWFVFVKASKCVYGTLKLSLSNFTALCSQGIFKGINHPA